MQIRNKFLVGIPLYLLVLTFLIGTHYVVGQSLVTNVTLDDSIQDVVYLYEDGRVEENQIEPYLDITDIFINYDENGDFVKISIRIDDKPTKSMKLYMVEMEKFEGVNFTAYIEDFDDNLDKLYFLKLSYDEDEGFEIKVDLGSFEETYNDAEISQRTVENNYELYVSFNYSKTLDDMDDRIAVFTYKEFEDDDGVKYYATDFLPDSLYSGEEEFDFVLIIVIGVIILIAVMVVLLIIRRRNRRPYQQFGQLSYQQRF